MRFLSFAKVNLALEVLGRRDDGFHELRTTFQTIDLADDIELLPAKAGVALTITGAAGLPADESNLAWRAAAGFLERWGRAGEGVSIRLHKRIPLGGGLGGGSSNAATVIAGLSVLMQRNPGKRELETFAAELGSDVPFFLHGGTALGTGRGECIVPLPDPAAAALDLWLALPPVAVSTAGVFAAHRVRAPISPPAGYAGEGIPVAWSELLGRNDLEPTCLALYPAVADVYNRLSESGAAVVRLSGSGSTIYALFRDRAAGEAAGERLGQETIWLPVRTLSRCEWLRRSGLDALSGGS